MLAGAPRQTNAILLDILRFLCAARNHNIKQCVCICVWCKMPLFYSLEFEFDVWFWENFSLLQCTQNPKKSRNSEQIYME